VSFTAVLLLNECLLLKAYISLSIQSGNFWIHLHTCIKKEGRRHIRNESKKKRKEKCNPWSRILLEKLTVSHVVIKFPVLMESITSLPRILGEGKVQVKLSLCSTKHQAMKVYGGVEV
jgi:hypothetical protein